MNVHGHINCLEILSENRFWFPDGERWVGFCIPNKSQGEAAAAGPPSTLSEVLGTSCGIQLDLIKTDFNAVKTFSKRKQRMCEF